MNLRTFRTRSFVLNVRECDEDERPNDHSRDYLAVDIRYRPDGESITVIVGSPTVATTEIWSEGAAARAAVSFASEPSAWDDPHDREWSETYGSTLSDECIGHVVLGVGQ